MNYLKKSQANLKGIQISISKSKGTISTFNEYKGIYLHMKHESSVQYNYTFIHTCIYILYPHIVALVQIQIWMYI